MADSLISARVPKAKRDAVGEVLKSLGSSTTELVNRAFDYVLAEKKLPEVEAAGAQRVGADDFCAFVGKTTFDIPWSEADGAASYKEILSAGKRADYERLA